MRQNDDAEFTRFVLELMQSVGPVTHRRMFGGAGLFLEGLMIGLIADRALYFKVDSETEAAFVEAGLMPFTYQRAGRDVALSYREAPEEVFDDIDAMRDWGGRAWSAAIRSAARKRRR
ncbi:MULTISPECIES: TfoX/Sxy family protein [Marinobacter]|uniref:TfoX/Sxy family protein n=1 Tax=Marinobacter TaxID=2742 RepID=UPI000DAD61A7|nr:MULTISPECIES: TfoX/Sxy family protein [Marinobacter]